MGGKSKTTQETKIDPVIQGMQVDNFNRAKGIANTPVQPYSGALDLSQSQGAARGLLDFSAPTVSGSSYNPASYSAQTGQASTYDPATINRGLIANLSTGPASAEAIKAYQDPFQGQAIDAFQTDHERQRQMAIQQGQAQATASGAFGGSRHGVADSLTNEASIRSGDAYTAGLRSTGFQTALGAAQADMARRLQADQANQGIDYNVASQNAGFSNQAGQFNAGQRQSSDFANLGFQNQAGMFNAGAANDASRYGADAAQRAELANQQAAISGAGVRAQGAGLLGNLQSQEYQSAYDEWLRQQNDPMVKQGLLNQSLGGVQAGQTTTGTAPKGGLFGTGIKVGWSWKDGLSAGSA